MLLRRRLLCNAVVEDSAPPVAGNPAYISNPMSVRSAYSAGPSHNIHSGKKRHEDTRVLVSPSLRLCSAGIVVMLLLMRGGAKLRRRLTPVTHSRL